MVFSDRLANNKENILLSKTFRTSFSCWSMKRKSFRHMYKKYEFMSFVMTSGGS